MDTEQGGEFDWDEHNLTHLSRHKITPSEFEEAMRNDRVFMDVEDESGEERWYVAGVTNGLRVLVLVFTSPRAISKPPAGWLPRRASAIRLTFEWSSERRCGLRPIGSSFPAQAQSN